MVIRVCVFLLNVIQLCVTERHTFEYHNTLLSAILPCIILLITIFLCVLQLSVILQIAFLLRISLYSVILSSIHSV